jgi:hypothetical protein
LSRQTVRIPCPDTNWIEAKSKALLGILHLLFLCLSPGRRICVLERICYVMSEVLLLNLQTGSTWNFPGRLRTIPQPRTLEPTLWSNADPRTVLDSPGPLIFQWILQHRRTGFQWFSIHSTDRTDAALRSHHLDVREYHPECVQTATTDFTQDQWIFFRTKCDSVRPDFQGANGILNACFST